MKQFDFTVAITLLVLISMQIVSGIAVFKSMLEVKDYLSMWAPVLTAAMGYWFRGTQAQAADAKPST